MYKPLTPEQVDIIKNIVKKWEKSTYAYAINDMSTNAIMSLYYESYKKHELIEAFLKLIVTNFDRIKNYPDFKGLNFEVIENTETIEPLIDQQIKVIDSIISLCEKQGKSYESSNNYQYNRAKLHGMVDTYQAIGGKKEYYLYL
jgi:hypothetical protein